MHWSYGVPVLLTLVWLHKVSTTPIQNLIIKETDDVIIDSCTSPVYCKGKLLDVVQKAKIFNDSKTFVDMSQVNPVDVTLDHFW